MSKIGKRTLIFHECTTVSYEKKILTVIGKHGELRWKIPKNNFSILIENNSLKVLPCNKERKNSLADKCMWGTINARIKNMIEGVSKPFEKTLKIVGIGYRCKQEGQILTFKLGYSHDVKITIPLLVQVALLKQTNITVTSIDKELLGSFCAKIRDLAKPEPYLGKGIRYANEVLKKKVGKRAGK